MNTNDFLRLLWPETGPYLIGVPVRWVEDGKEKKGVRHYAHDDIDKAAEHAQALAWDREAPKDVYFALGSLVERRKKKARKADNIKELRAFWFDLDVDADPKKYATQTEALKALKKFVEQAQLPRPVVVNSGYGVHVYWPLTYAIDRQVWLKVAFQLKALARTLGLKADPSRTADCASVLRPVGTANWKREQPARVTPMVVSPPTEPELFFERIRVACEANQVELTQPTAASPGLGIEGDLPDLAQVKGAQINQEAATGGVAPPSDPKRVIKRCKQLRFQLTNPSEVSEPSWYDMVGCLRHCVNGRAAVHKVSAAYPSYSRNETDEKIDHHIEGGIGPTLCSTFEDHNPESCEGCPHRNKIRSPIVLGYSMEQAEVPEAEIHQNGATASIELPDPPYPFQRVKNSATGEVQIAMILASEDGEDVQDLIYEHDLYPSRITYDERESKFKATMRRFLPKDGWDEFTFPLGDLFDRRSLAKLLGNIGVLPDSGRMDVMVQYMIGYLKQLQKRAAASVVYAQLGWREDDTTFILPDQVITPQGNYKVDPSSNIDNALEWTMYPPQGDLEAWKQAVAGYNREGMESHLFLFGAGFAAPLFKFTPYAGMVISAVGPSGCGKSTAALCANTIWGHPHLGWADIENDTLRAFYNKLGVLRHLPATFDEITNLHPDEVSNLCYAVSKGRGRQRLEQDGSAKANLNNWQTLMITTSNSSLQGKLAGAKVDSSAEAVRVFEFYMPEQTMTKAEADAQFLPVMSNYGLAGPVFARGLVDNLPWVKLRILEWGKALDKAARIGSAERFWSAGAACVLTGFELANKVGLTQVDLKRVFQFAVSTIEKMRMVVLENTNTPITLLTDYINGNLRNTLILSQLPSGSKTALVTHSPSGELRIRYEVWCGKMYIDKSHFRRWCIDKGVDFFQMRRALSGDRILVSDQSRIMLGRNTSFSSPQTMVWTIDMNHPHLGTVVRAIDSEVGEGDQQAAAE